MAISRLLLPKPGGPHFHGRGLIQSTNWYAFSSFSSGGSEKSSTLKGLEEPKEGKAGDKESNKNSGTWFRRILTNVKQKMLGTPHIQEPTARETSNSKVDLMASEVAKTETSQHDTKHVESQSVSRSLEVIMSSPRPTEVVSSSSTSKTVLGENDFEGSIVTATVEACKMHSNPGNSGLSDMQCIVKPPEAVIVSHGDENGKLRNLPSDIMMGNSSMRINKSGNLSDIFVKKLKNEVKQFEESLSDVLVPYDKEQSPSTEDLLSLTEELFSEKPKTLLDGKNDLSLPETTNRLLGNRTKTLSQRSNVSPKSGKKHKSSKSSSGANDLVNIIKREQNDEAATVEMAGKLHDTPATVESLAGKKVENLKIEDLIKCIRKLPQEESTDKAQEWAISNVTDQYTNVRLLKDVQRQATWQSSDVKRRPKSLKQHDMSNENEMSLKEELSIHVKPTSDRKEGSSLNLANCDNVKSGQNYHVPLPISQEELNSSSQTCSSKKGSNENKVLIRFLTKNIQKRNILVAFSDCGPIVNVEEVSTTEGSIFKDFLVHFKTRTGCQNALKKNYFTILSREVLVEAICSEDKDNAISIPDLLGDPDAPVALVKNPTRTIKIEDLSDNISLQQLKEALAFCHSHISKFFLGSTSSVRYVEFETEDAKERALAEHSLFISGKELPIRRIDAPRTTVVRISNFNPKSKIWAICNSRGQVKSMKKRATGIVDVHFKLAEWPNMLNIVNSLNGMEVDENRWLAQPAPVFPPAVVQALWRQPEERRHVNAVICNLLRKLEKPIPTTALSQLSDLATKYYGKVL